MDYYLDSTLSIYMLDAVFKALSDPSRRKILSLLRKKDRTVSELQEYFAFTGATLSHHLDSLKRANLVIATRDKQFIRYSLNTSVFEEVMSAFYSLFPR